MKNNNKRILRLSVVTAIMLGSSAYAGTITGATPTDRVVKNTQFGFGGWDLTHVAVSITDTEYHEIASKTFDTDDGSYSSMVLGDSFESKITTESEVRGKLHGKEWPVGEPAGIKVINGDTGTNGKPDNCILTTSYLDGADLSSSAPKPVICSSDFQSHKRFNINLQPLSAPTAGAKGKPVDLVFNLQSGDTPLQRYQVLEKINNYTDKRLDGYTVEVLDAKGQPNTALTFSLGIGENAGTDIWDETERANFSDGLWGDSHTEAGFFDDAKVYYPVALSPANDTISYSGDLKGGNYQMIFGNWIPSAWEPTGILWDDDNDASTDAVLMAFYGDPLSTGTDAWHKGKVDSWAIPTDEERLRWSSPPYSEEGIEDTLNLGLNYIIEVGSRAAIGSKFTLRITPHVAVDQNPPTYMNAPIPPISDAIADETVAISPAPTFIIGNTLKVLVKDSALNLDPHILDVTTVTVVATNGDSESITLTETNINSSVFSGTLPTEYATSNPIVNDGVMSVDNNTIVSVSYGPNTSSTTALLTGDDTSDLPLDTDGNPASAGGGCSYNPNAKSFDMMFLLIAALGLFYPFRRKFFAKTA